MYCIGHRFISYADRDSRSVSPLGPGLASRTRPFPFVNSFQHQLAGLALLATSRILFAVNQHRQLLNKSIRVNSPAPTPSATHNRPLKPTQTIPPTHRTP